MGVVFSMLWRLDATTACVALFVVALGSLWLYVAFANPSSREYERLEELLSESAVAPSSPAGGERREGKKGRGKGKTGNESSPRASQSPRKKKPSPETVTPSGSGTESGREEGEGRGGGERKTPPTQQSKKQVPKTAAVTGETVTDKSLAPGDEEGGEFKLVTSKSPRGKKEPAPVVTTSSVETGRDTSAAPVSKKKKKDRSKAAVSKNVSSTAKTTEEERGEIPAVTAITKPEDETPVVSKATEIEGGDPVASAETTSESDTPKAPAALVCREDAPGIGKKTRRKGRRKGEPEREGNSERVVSSGSGEEGERGDGKWHTQLSRQQLRALKQKEKKRVLSQQKTTSTSEMTTTTEMATTTEEKSKEKEGEKGLGRKSPQKTEEGGRVRRERVGGAKRWNLPNTVGTATVTEEATPTAVAASSAEDASEGPVAHSNTSDLEKAIREAACTSSSSSEDITSLQTTTTSVATSNNSSLATHTETQSTHTTPTDNVVFPSATVTMDSGPARGPSDEETMGVKGAESPDTDDWVVLEPPT